MATEGDEEKVKVVTEIAEECKDTADDDRYNYIEQFSEIYGLINYISFNFVVDVSWQ